MDGDFIAFAGMILSLLILLIIGGFILMFPLTKRLGELMEQRINERKTGGPREGGTSEVAELRRAVRSLEAEVATLAERQRFVEGLLDSPGRTRSIAGGQEG